MFDCQSIITALIDCDEPRAIGLVKEALDQGETARTVLNKGLIAGMDIVGERMENEEMFIPEVLMAAQAMGTAVETLKPLLSEDDAGSAAKMVKQDSMNCQTR